MTSVRVTSLTSLGARPSQLNLLNSNEIWNREIKQSLFLSIGLFVKDLFYKSHSNLDALAVRRPSFILQIKKDHWNNVLWWIALDLGQICRTGIWTAQFWKIRILLTSQVDRQRQKNKCFPFLDNRAIKRKENHFSNSWIIHQNKKRKPHLWRRFGYLASISIDFDDFTSPFTS